MNQRAETRTDLREDTKMDPRGQTRMDRILSLALLISAVSCVHIDGGAVEASWVVRSDDGRAITDCGCSDPAIASVRIALLGNSGTVRGQEPCRDRKECEFACQRSGGATPFDIPPGSYMMSVMPLDAAGQDLFLPASGVSPVLAPAGILREVVRGQPTQLPAFQLVAKCAGSCAGANESKVCERQ